MPVLGWLFKSRETQNIYTNLLVFLTPSIVANPEEADRIYREKSGYMNELKEAQEGELAPVDVPTGPDDIPTGVGDIPMGPGNIPMGPDDPPLEPGVPSGTVNEPAGPQEAAGEILLQ
jgi:hypothetical protein